jgi:hypothetical protein
MKTQILLMVGMIALMPTEAYGQVTGDNSPHNLPAAPSGQTNRGTTMSDCDYNACALRMNLSWGSWRIVRGEQEQRVATLGMFRTPRLESLVHDSPQAVAEAQVFQKNYMPGELFTAVGAALLGVSSAASQRDGSVVLPLTGIVVGSGLLFYGVSRSVRAMNALHKSIWIYNGSLKR